jgi:hypothetical protein
MSSRPIAIILGRNPYQRAAFLVILFVASYSFWISRTGVFYADSPEFAVAALYLDIAHPAGFPLPHLLGSLFVSLLPGSLTFRLGLLPIVLGAALLVIVYLLIRELVFTRSEREKFLSFLVAVGILLCTPDYWKHQFVLEAYLLHAVLLLSLLWSLLVFMRLKDARYLFFGAFLAGLALANHASSAIIVGPSALLIGVRYWKLFLPVLCFGLLGLSLYLYLPLRSISSPPLDTGSPRTVSRAFALMSAERERHIRSSSFAEFSVNSQLWTSASLLDTAVEDFLKLDQILGAALIVLACIGFIFIIHQGWAAGLLAIFFFGTQVFFLGWSSDPWFLSICLLSILASVSIVRLATYFSLSTSPAIIFSVVLWFCITSILFRPGALNQVFEIKNYVSKERADRFADFTRSLPAGSTLLTEHLTFPLLYGHYVLGQRPDITLVQLASLRFPKYFSLLNFRDSNGNPFNTAVLMESESQILLEGLAYLDQAAPLLIEPSNQFFGNLRQISTVDPSGFLRLQTSTDTSVSTGDDFADAVAGHFQLQVRDLQEIPKTFFFESRNLAEALLLVQAHYLWLTDRQELAISTIERACFNDVSETTCSHRPLINLASYLTERGSTERAIALLEYAKHLTKRAPPELIKNLATARAKQSS